MIRKGTFENWNNYTAIQGQISKYTMTMCHATYSDNNRRLSRTSLLLDTAALGNTCEPVEEHCHADVENDEHPEESKVPPAVVIARVDLSQESGGCSHFAELAVGCRIRVSQCAVGPRHEGLEILAACLTAGRFKVPDLDI